MFVVLLSPPFPPGQFQRNFRFHRLGDVPKGCPSSRVLPSSGGTQRIDEEEQRSSGSDTMDIDAGPERIADAPAGGNDGGRHRRWGDTGNDSFSSQVDSKEQEKP